MTFSEWLRAQPTKHQDIARSLGVSGAHLSRLASTPPKSGISLKLAAKIERLTGGEVPVASWLAETGNE